VELNGVLGTDPRPVPRLAGKATGYGAMGSIVYSCVGYGVNRVFLYSVGAYRTRFVRRSPNRLISVDQILEPPGSKVDSSRPKHFVILAIETPSLADIPCGELGSKYRNTRLTQTAADRRPKIHRGRGLDPFEDLSALLHALEHSIRPPHS